MDEARKLKFSGYVHQNISVSSQLSGSIQCRRKDSRFFNMTLYL